MSFPKDLAISDSRGTILQSWHRFFLSLVSPGQAAQSITVGASPFVKAFPGNGFVTISGGTVSLVEFKRPNGTYASVGVTAGAIPVRTSDAVRITYTVAPTVTYYAD